MPTKVVHVITGLDTGGAEVMLSKLVSMSRRDAFNHHVISLKTPGPIADQIRQAGIEVESVDMSGGLGDTFALASLAAKIRRARPHLVQSWMYHANFMGVLVRPAIGAPVVWNIRASYAKAFGRKTGMVIHAGARLSGLPVAIVTNSLAALKQHEQIGYSPKAWEVIPNGFDITLFRPDSTARADVRRELGLSPDALIIGMVGRYHAQKDYPSFFRAASQLMHVVPHAQFVLVGKGLSQENGEITALLNTAGLTGRVSLLGERRDIPRLTAAFDIATLTSAFGESFPNAIGEAMASGVPCVVTDVGDSGTIVGKSGIVVSPGRPDEIADGWRRVAIMTPDERGEIGQLARRRVEDLFSLESVVARYEHLYSRVVRG